MATTLDTFRALLRTHARECPMPDGSPDYARHLDGPHWSRFARAGWIEALPSEPGHGPAWRLTAEGRAIAESVQLHAGRPASPATAERARERLRLQAAQAARVLVARFGPELAAEAFTEALGA